MPLAHVAYWLRLTLHASPLAASHAPVSHYCVLYCHSGAEAEKNTKDPSSGFDARLDKMMEKPNTKDKNTAKTDKKKSSGFEDFENSKSGDNSARASKLAEREEALKKRAVAQQEAASREAAEKAAKQARIAEREAALKAKRQGEEEPQKPSAQREKKAGGVADGAAGAPDSGSVGRHWNSVNSESIVGLDCLLTGTEVGMWLLSVLTSLIVLTVSGVTVSVCLWLSVSVSLSSAFAMCVCVCVSGALCLWRSVSVSQCLYGWLSVPMCLALSVCVGDVLGSKEDFVAAGGDPQEYDKQAAKKAKKEQTENYRRQSVSKRASESAKDPSGNKGPRRGSIDDRQQALQVIFTLTL